MADKFLFKLVNAGVTSSPGLTPGNNSAPTLNPIGNGVIDVLNDFPWTNTNAAARNDTPRVTLKEYNVTRSSLFQQARYLLSSTPDVASALQQGMNSAGWAGALVIGAGAAVAGRNAAGPGKRLIGALEGVGMAAAVSTGAATLVAKGQTWATSKLGLSLKQNTNLKSYLQPYDQLYATAPTGFQYHFPYFAEEWKKSENNWSSLSKNETYNKFDTAMKQMIEGGFKGGGLGGMTGAGALRAFFPAAYVENPKQFDYGDGDKESKSISFTLFNTTTFEDVVRNWQLCFLLMYQNRPNRSSRVLVDTPVIYEVNIPGIYYCPFAFINSIEIKQVGGTRRMVIPILTSNVGDFNTRLVQTSTGPREVSVRPVGGPTESTSSANLDTLIPDSYEVKIQLTPLVTESKNLMYQTITNNDSVYDVSMMPSAK
jgi:hypothetical protein